MSAPTVVHKKGFAQITFTATCGHQVVLECQSISADAFCRHALRKAQERCGPCREAEAANKARQLGLPSSDWMVPPHDDIAVTHVRLGEFDVAKIAYIAACGHAVSFHCAREDVGRRDAAKARQEKCSACQAGERRHLSFRALADANAARQNEGAPRGETITPLYRAVELAGEVGEAVNVVKKLERERLGIAGSRATQRQLADELADVVICVDLLATVYNIDLGEAVRAKFNATSEKVGLKQRL